MSAGEVMQGEKGECHWVVLTKAPGDQQSALELSLQFTLTSLMGLSQVSRTGRRTQEATGHLPLGLERGT